MKFSLSALLILIAFLNFAPTSAQQTPQKESRPVEFVDITSRAGIKWGVKQLAPGVKYLIETMGGGGGFIDYNNDGLLDIYLVGYSQTLQPGASAKPKDKLYRNNGNGTFADITDKAGVNNRAWGASAAWFDYDSDGYLDLFVTNYLSFAPEGKVPCDFFDGRPYCYLSK